MEDTKLITKEALQAQKVAKQNGTQAKVPVLTYLIENLLLFEFQGTPLLLIAFENHSVKMFEADTGHFDHEFKFHDNSLDNSATSEEEIRIKEQNLQK